MLLDTLKDDGTYFKATLLECLAEARDINKLDIHAGYKTIMRREKKGVACYLGIERDPVNGWRMYSGRQIREIVRYEFERAKAKNKND